MRTLCFTVNLDSVGNMPCNPAIGGTGKGHLVRELDALGGEMGRAADKACNPVPAAQPGQGPRRLSLRAQADRREYQKVMKHTLERQENLWVKQAEVVDIRTENGAVSAVVTHTGAVYAVRAVVVATGTYLGGRTIVGEVVRDSGPDGLAAALPLTDCLVRLGLSIRRFKTGTPPRVNARSVDFSKMERQDGDPDAQPFSFSTKEPPEIRRCAGSPTPTGPPTTSSGPIWTAPPSTTAPSRGWVPGTAPPSRPRWSASPTRSATSCSSSPWAWTPRSCTSRASPPPCPRRSSWRCSTPSPAWSGPR